MTVATGETKCVYKGIGWRTPAAFAPDGKSLLVNDCRRAMTDQDFAVSISKQAFMKTFCRMKAGRAIRHRNSSRMVPAFC